MARPNPGALSAKAFVPTGGSGVPLVVVLHGCTQTADGYDVGAGWSAVAERNGFAVLLPEQSVGNNPNRCFNWFQPGDTRRDSGEALSIRNMVAEMVERRAIDPARVFVTGLSAGGAMASVMLAAYPEVFAGGAIIAGLPFGTADTIPQAFDRMRGHGLPDAAQLGRLVAQASGHAGPWPTVAVWHGSADATVSQSNAEAILDQWRALHGVAAAPDRRDIVDGAVRRQWADAGGRVCLEDYRITGMGHGTPLTSTGTGACGSPMPYMLDVGISSTWHIASSWGLVDPSSGDLAIADEPVARDREPSSPPMPHAIDVQATIEQALRSAGLMR
ncbi:alpha/beta hydrolase family esterase [Sphingomonas sp. Leaf33]|uniref:extracellular catalytic domain type 1 short-chain-length polyhydroxyalkanoate depolymerase n=1 Tax=Sphingomonas sp. Leaf33 TaxID=1736215 RepID=UPI001F1A5253|nr:PHB depolymerase family esterase [Sphingomonas sp. Leaf33]